MTLLYTTQNLVDEVRAGIDEHNTDSVSTAGDILPALNRAQSYAFDIYARKYPEPILRYTTLTLTSGTAEYDIPETTYEDRILKLEICIPGGGVGGGNYYVPVQRLSYTEISDYESAAPTAVPRYYCVIGRRIRLLGVPNGTYSARLWDLRNPEKLVLPQGRITLLNEASNYVILDSVGEDLTTESDLLSSYVNIVDGQSGLVKATAQIQSITENRITFRSSPTRSSVLSRTVSGTPLEEDSSGSVAAADDYICLSDGICVPYYGNPTNNFLIQYAIADIRGGKLGGEPLQEEKLLEKFEKQLERTWVGRERTARIRRTSRAWSRPASRWSRL